jgi:hypothetical protein
MFWLSNNSSYQYENLEFQPNTQIVAIYYNGGKKNLFRIHVNITLGDLKHKLTQLNGRVHHRDQRRVTKLNQLIYLISNIFSFLYIVVFKFNIKCSFLLLLLLLLSSKFQALILTHVLLEFAT